MDGGLNNGPAVCVWSSPVLLTFLGFPALKDTYLACECDKKKLLFWHFGDHFFGPHKE